MFRWITMCLLFLPSLCWAGEIIPLQWTYSRLVPGAPGYFAGDVEYPGGRTPTINFSGGRVQLGDTMEDPYGWLSERFPYRVPDGYWLLLTDVDFATKQLTLRNSYFILDNVVIVPSGLGHFRPTIPHIIPPGVQVNAEVFNNSPETQYMTVRVAGFLLPQVAGETYSM